RPAEPPIRSPDRKVNPAVGAVEKHNPDPGAKEREDPTRLLPPGSQQPTNQIRSHQGEPCPQPHADKGEGRQRAQEMPPLLRWVTGQTAQGGHSDSRERGREL